MPRGTNNELKQKFVDNIIEESDISEIRTKTRAEIGRRFIKERRMSIIRELCRKHAGNSVMALDDLSKVLKIGYASIRNYMMSLGFSISKIQFDGEYWIVIDHKKEGA
ncbi:MAG: hypothetical protein KGD60_13815 [Candidatus Thorarchaeota archaeon]|nr:hypothetical protein [Candidatus Thorarchaeota archaeon]